MKRHAIAVRLTETATGVGRGDVAPRSTSPRKEDLLAGARRESHVANRGDVGDGVTARPCAVAGHC